MNDGKVVTEQTRRAYGELLFMEQMRAGEVEEHAARLVAGGDVRGDLAAWRRAASELADVRAALALFPEGTTTPEPPPDPRIESLSHNIVTRARQKDYILKHELPAMEARLAVPPTPRELAEWQGFNDPFERHYNRISEQIAVKLADIEKMEQESARDSAEMQRLKERVGRG
jgi:hypothetical protein